MKFDTKLIELIEEKGTTARGKKELIKHLNGESLTPRQAMRAKCYDCMGYYGDGKIDCGINNCPMYGFMPYRKLAIKN